MCNTSSSDDAHLVQECLAGRRESFAPILERYQSLVCSILYSATGSLSQSEDLAQETFVIAWKQLGQLKDPARLRPWLCAIARSVLSKAQRRHQRDVGMAAGVASELHQVPADEPVPSEQAVSREEEALLWQALDQIPETYREPLILFYREGDSVERVAAALDLSEATARQRLSRGRKMLQEQVLALVEGSLRRTKPGKAFTLMVLAALPTLVTPATAAGSSLIAAGTSAPHGASGWLSGSAFPLASAILGVLGAYLGLKGTVSLAQSPRERLFLVTLVRLALLFVINAAAAALGVLWLSWPLAQAQSGLWIGGMAGLGVVYFLFLLALAAWGRDQLRQLRRHPHFPPHSIEAGELNYHPRQRRLEFRSRWSLLGLPLVHIKFGDYYARELGAARGWIAIGDTAVGVFFAAGWMAMGGIALGGVASVGLLSAGLLAVGGLALGAEAVGLLAVGAGAFGWLAAYGGVACSNSFALGGWAMAPHANDTLAREFFSSGLAESGQWLRRHAYALGILALWPWFLAWRETRLLAAPPNDSQHPAGATDPKREMKPGWPASPPASEATLSQSTEGCTSDSALQDPLSDPVLNRRRLIRLMFLLPVLVVSIYLFFAFHDPNGPRNPNGGHTMTWQSTIAFCIGLASGLSVLFTSLALMIPRGFAPGWQVRCLKCGLTVDASLAGQVRVGGFGRRYVPGRCQRCGKWRLLAVEPVSDTPRPSPGSPGCGTSQTQ